MGYVLFDLLHPCHVYTVVLSLSCFTQCKLIDVQISVPEILFSRPLGLFALFFSLLFLHAPGKQAVIKIVKTGRRFYPCAVLCCVHVQERWATYKVKRQELWYPPAKIALKKWKWNKNGDTKLYINSTQATSSWVFVLLWWMEKKSIISIYIYI